MKKRPMKGTFISADFAQDSSGSLKFLEINTDTTLGGKLPEGDGFWNNLIQLISGSSLTGENITEFHVVYKKQIHSNLVSVLSSSLTWILPRNISNTSLDSKITPPKYE